MKKVFLILVVSILFIPNIKALNYKSGQDMNFSISCLYNENGEIRYSSDGLELSAGERATCSVSFTSVIYGDAVEQETQYFKKASFDLIVPSPLVISSITTKPGYTANNNDNSYTFETTALKETEGTLLTFKVVMPNVAPQTIYNISLDNIAVYNINNQEIGTYGDKTTRLIVTKPKSTINTLSELKVDGVSVPNFSINNIQYTLPNTDKDSIKITAIKSDSSSTISGDIGTKNIVYGLNTFNINVKSESGLTKTYKINITRNDIRTTVNTLKNITLSSGILKFDSDTTTYNVKVGNSVNNIIIESTLTDSKSSYVTGFGNRSVALNVGNNIVYIKVKSETDEEKTYTLNITRKEEGQEISNNAYLKNITVKDYQLEFSKDKYNYTLIINNENNLEIEALSEDSNALIYIEGNENLTNDSKIKINVLAEDGITTKTYYLNIKINKSNKILKMAGGIILGIVIITLIGSLANKKETNKIVNSN